MARPSPPPPPARTPAQTLNSPPRLANGEFQFTISGAVGQSAIILASTNLATWSPLGTNTLTNGTAVFPDSQAASFNRRLYRAQLAPSPRLAQQTGVEIYAFIEWDDTEGAANPGQKATLQWSPP
jgi:hypothetical protein